MQACILGCGLPGHVLLIANFSILVCRRDGFYLELIQEMPDIEDVVVAEEQRSESFNRLWLYFFICKRICHDV